MIPDLEGWVDEGLRAANDHSSMGAIGGGRGDGDKGGEVLSEPEIPDEPMKTMAELAAEHAERQRELGLESTRRSKSSGRGVRSSRVQRKAVDDEGEDEPEVGGDEDLSEPSLNDYLSDSPAPSKKRKATSSATPSRTNNRASSKSIPKPRKKRARSPDTDEGPNVGYDRSSGPKSTSTRPRPKRKGATTTMNLTTGASRTVSGSNPAVTVPASDRVLRSRKAKI